jgi:hypothetical protein
MSKKEYLNNIKIVNDKRMDELNQIIKNIDEGMSNYDVQKINAETEIAKLGVDNTMLDEIIAIIPDNS